MKTLNKLKVINLISGPGAGKSTIRAGIFNLMKNAGKNVEETTEYAKDLTWDESQAVLSDQLFILANQNRRLDRLKNKVEWVVTDAPLILSINYVMPHYLPQSFTNLAFELWNTYENINVFIKRVKPYNPIGRNQTKEGAMHIDSNIRYMLNQYSIRYIEVEGDSMAHYTICDKLGIDISLPDGMS